MNKDNSWLAPLTGVAFVVLVIIGFAIGGEPPEFDSPAGELVDHYVDNKNKAMVGALLEGIAATLFVFFGGYVRRVLRAAEGERGMLSAIAFAGTIIFAVGLAIDATITMALAESAEDVDPSAVQALVALFQNDYMPFAVGLQVFLLAMGLVAVRTGAIPKWIGWIAILLGVIAVTPIGFAAFIGSGILVLVLGVVLTMRERAAQPRT